jgi:hypothetical protein
MRRWVYMAVLSAALLTIPLWGQRGGHGGMARGGAHGAPAGAYHGANGGGRGNASHSHSYSGHYVHYRYYSGRIRHYYYRRGYGYGYPYASWVWYDPGWYGASDSFGAQSGAAYVDVPSNSANSYVADEQQREIDRLDEEVARLRAERESGADGNSMRQSPSKALIDAETVIVYRNHHTEGINNYAIVGKTLWVFTEERARKIPIAELDRLATMQANDARGIDFKLPEP